MSLTYKLCNLCRDVSVMNKAIVAQQVKTASFLQLAQGLFQGKGTGGNFTIVGGKCVKNKIGLQRKLVIGRSNDPLQQEADRASKDFDNRKIK